MDLLTICPTRNRVEKCRKMVKSFNATQRISSLILLIDIDDINIREYMKMDCQFHCGDKETITERMNKPLILEICNRYKYIHITNDDFVYHTQGWDEILCKRIELKGDVGIAYGNDLVVKELLPTAPVISTNIIKALGWIQMPRLKHLYGDAVWKVIGHKLNIIHYCPNVIIEHQHPQRDKRYEDDLHKITNNREMYVEDHINFKQWIHEDYLDDIKKIERMINGHKS